MQHGDVVMRATDDADIGGIAGTGLGLKHEVVLPISSVPAKFPPDAATVVSGVGWVTPPCDGGGEAKNAGDGAVTGDVIRDRPKNEPLGACVTKALSAKAGEADVAATAAVNAMARR